MTPELRAKHSETLLSTISAFAEEAPAFEEAGVETFECGEIAPVIGFCEPRDISAARIMCVTIDGEHFLVLVYPQSA